MSHDELYGKVREFVDKLPKKLHCPACNDHHWELRFLDNALVAAAPTEKIPPVVTIMCTCCGHLSFFDTKAMGLAV